MNEKLYNLEIKKICDSSLAWEKLSHKTLLISGATGTIGKMMIDVLMMKNQTGLNCHVVALGRNIEKARKMFSHYFDENLFSFYSADVNCPLEFDIPVNFILHMASNTHPLQYANDPIGTINTNVIGTNNLLQYALKQKCERFVFLSSVEIYGECKDGNDFQELSLGYINCSSLRAGYPESKRLGETLCHAYAAKHNLDIVIPRLGRVYGPTITNDDSKAVSQFFKKALSNEDIILKSEGTQFYSYCYVSDAVRAILFLLFEGKKGEAYNVASTDSNITLRDLAKKIADYSHLDVKFELPNEVEKKGFSTATRAILDCTKINNIGWISMVTIDDGIKRTLDMLSESE